MHIYNEVIVVCVVSWFQSFVQCAREQMAKNVCKHTSAITQVDAGDEVWPCREAAVVA